MKQTHRPVSRLMQGSAIAIALAVLAPAALAQDKEADTAKTESTEAAQEETGTVVITGSRIRHRGAQSATPTSVISADTIQKTGTRQIADLVNQLPALVVSQSDQTSNANRDKDSMDASHPGMNALDLRGLGTKRTLVLVSGRRHVPGAPGSAAVDISTIPSSLVERVEVITGGASALYGADAVAGVANFILKKNFEGIDANVRYGNSSRNDMPSYDVDLLYGKNFADGKGNFTLFGYYGVSDGTVGGQDRPWTAAGNPWWARVPGQTAAPYLNYILDGRQNLGYSPRAQVLLGGKPWTFNDDGTMRAPILGPGGILPNTYDMTKPETIANLETNGGEYGGRYDNWLLSVPNDRFITHGTFNYALSDNLKYFLEVDYATNKSHGEYGMWYEGGSNWLWEGNPFITDEMIAANGGSLPYVSFVRQYPEMGKASSHYKRDLAQVVTGFEGNLPSLFRDHDWAWSVYASYGRTEETIQDRNQVSNERYMRALDAVSGPGGQPICWVNSDADTDNDDPNCVALNPFKPLTQDVMGYLTYNPGVSKSWLDQTVISGYATGALFTLPAGEVQAVIGGEYRKERNHIGAVAEYDPNNPAFVEDYGVIQNPLDGEFDVKEVFAELSVPILADLPFAQKLSMDAAIRSSDYSTAGQTTSWKYGLQYAPVRDVRLRATYGQAVRAPNISEVFTASSISGQWLYDPCNYYLPNRVENTQYTEANCAALNPANKNYYWVWMEVEKKGNENLKVETAKTLTVGLVFQPRVVKNLTFSIDYYDIDMSDVIAAVEPQTIINKCVDFPMENNPYCDLVVREDGTNNITRVIKQNINLAQRLNRGVDMELDYFVDLSSWGWGSNAGRLSINSVYTHLLENKITPDPDNPANVTDTVGVFGFPEWKGRTSLSYANGPLWLSWNVRHYTPMRMNTTITREAYSPWRTKAIYYNDFYASYQLKPNLILGAGISNVLDTAPPRYPGAEAGGAYFGDEGWQSGIYDVIGRTGFISLKYKH